MSGSCTSAQLWRGTVLSMAPSTKHCSSLTVRLATPITWMTSQTQNTTALIQPVNQDVATFKEARAGGTHAQSAVLDFWRDYSILDAMYNISQC